MGIIKDIPLSVLQGTPSPEMSARYVHINSMDIVKHMKREGWQLTAAKSVTPRVHDPLYAKHMIEFQRKDAPVVLGMKPRIVVVNSHDGSTRAFAAGGYFRMVCSNGLLIGHKASFIRARHSGANAETFVADAQRLSAVTDRYCGYLAQWARLKLSQRQQDEYARLVGVLRFGDSQAYKPSELLQVRREEDASNSLLTVYNRVQENTTKGGLSGLARTGRRIMSRPVHSITYDVEYNAALWRMTEELGKLWK